jgi:hypothetical protein
MENINYSLKEYFEKKYPVYDWPAPPRASEGGPEHWCAPDQAPVDKSYASEHEEYNKLITDLWNLFTPYNLKLIDNDEEFYSEWDIGNCGEKNRVASHSTFKKYVYEEEDFMEYKGISCNPFNFKGFTNITPEIFLKDIKDILEKYCILGWNSIDNQELNSVASVFMKYIEIKTPPHIIEKIKSHQNTIDKFRERENKINWELKQYKELKELQDMEDLIKKNKSLIEENKSLMEENIKLVEKEDIRKKVQQWLEINSDKINFKIGKKLYDIII